MNTFVGAPYAKGSDTSRDAATSIANSAGDCRARIFGFIGRPEGSTCDEAEAAFGWRHQTVSARFWELERSGLIKKSEARRATRSGRAARVYVPVSAEVEA